MIPMHDINLYDVIVHKGRKIEIMTEPKLKNGQWSCKAWEVDTNRQDFTLILPANAMVEVVE